VFNYWEPLHFVLFGSGMQTWEYSSRFALRPWLYLWLHGAVAAPAAALSRLLSPGLGLGRSKKVAFYAVRVALALASAATEAGLAAAAGDVLGGGNGSGSALSKKRSGGGAAAPKSKPRPPLPAVSLILALLLATSAGMFSAAPALLPSSFVMLFLTWAAAEVLRGERPNAVVAAGVFGLLWGWPVASVAFLPYALWVLLAAESVAKTAAAALGLSALALAPLVLLDRLAYGKWTLSLLNFLRYNVSGDGGDSALYGVEEWHYYLRNSLLNLGAVVALAAAAPAVLGIAFAATKTNMISPPSAASVSPHALKRLSLALLPLPLWAATISSLPHKEERFLYPVYPLACLAAAAATAAAPSAAAAVVAAARGLLLPRSSSSRRRSPSSSPGSPLYASLSFALQASVVALAALVGASRVAALLASYSAPLRIYSSLPSDPAAQQQSSNGTAHSLVCLGAEWHRFPSSFLLPGGNYRMRFVAAGFGGLLPVPFDASRGGTAAAPDGLNDRNARDERNELADDAACDFFVGVAPPLGDAPREEGEKGGEIGEWRERAALPFLDVNAPAVRALPAPARAFYLPRWFARGVLRRPSWAAEEGLLKERGRYVLMERRRKKNVEE